MSPNWQYLALLHLHFNMSLPVWLSCSPWCLLSLMVKVWPPTILFEIQLNSHYSGFSVRTLHTTKSYLLDARLPSVQIYVLVHICTSETTHYPSPMSPTKIPCSTIYCYKWLYYYLSFSVFEILFVVLYCMDWFHFKCCRHPNLLLCCNVIICLFSVLISF